MNHKRSGLELGGVGGRNNATIQKVVFFLKKKKQKPPPKYDHRMRSDRGGEEMKVLTQKRFLGIIRLNFIRWDEREEEPMRNSKTNSRKKEGGKGTVRRKYPRE